MDSLVFFKHLATSILRNSGTKLSELQWFGVFFLKRDGCFLFFVCLLVFAICLYCLSLRWRSPLKSQYEQAQKDTRTPYIQCSNCQDIVSKKVPKVLFSTPGAHYLQNNLQFLRIFISFIQQETIYKTQIIHKKKIIKYKYVSTYIY